jgi:hypothetical protein
MLLIALQRFDEIRPGIQHKHKKEAEWEADYLIHRVVYGLAFLGSDFPLACRNSNKWFAGHPEYAHLGLSLASDTLAYTGHLGKARKLT